MEDEYLRKLKAIHFDMTTFIKALEELAAERRPSGAEITLAMRHLQDARMRLGVAACMEQGIDPWVSELKSKEVKE